ncbi:MAG: A/G-specific adenine glycosylase [Algoriphagus sp.]
MRKVVENQMFSLEILAWYRAHPRELPWRETQDPYKIWLSEIILQQTRVAQGLPYYISFVEAYPSVKDLAMAPESEVLRLWQGLGYYSRARNLHQCAKFIWHELQGNFPSTYESLLRLKGVGKYTAAAISSFAFGEAKAVVDGNVFRVLARYFGITTDIASSSAFKEFESLANVLLPKEQHSAYNQAIMDFGARCCVPKSPDCISCPLSSSCFAFQNNLVSALPVKENKTKVKDREINYLVLTCGTSWVCNQRGPGDIWTGLYDFPLLENLPNAPWARQQSPLLFPKKYRHLLSHRRLYVSFWELEISQENMAQLKKWADLSGYQLVEERQLDALPKPKLMLRYLNDRGI